MNKILGLNFVIRYKYLSQYYKTKFPTFGLVFFLFPQFHFSWIQLFGFAHL